MPANWYADEWFQMLKLHNVFGSLLRLGDFKVRDAQRDALLSNTHLCLSSFVLLHPAESQQSDVNDEFCLSAVIICWHVFKMTF